MSAPSRFWVLSPESASADDTEDPDDQRHEFAVAGVEDLVERDVAARADVQGAYARDIDVAAQRGEGRVELAAEGRAFHEIGGRVLGREAACQEQGEEERVEFLHVGRRFRG